MSYQGDIAEDATFRFTFNTRTTAGAPITIGGTAAAECYKDSNLTQTGTGVAITEDYDGVTGLHQCVMTLTDAFYVTGSDYSIVMSVGTVDGQSVVGETIGTFSIENRFMRGTDSANTVVPPTVAQLNARTLVAADYFDPDADAVAVVTLVTTTTNNSDMRGTDSAALATVATEARLAELDAANLPADVDTIKAKTDNLPTQVKKNTALTNFPFLMVDTSGDPATGLTITAQRSLDGAAFAACANAASELANGLYIIDLDASDLNGDTVALRFTATGAKDRVISIITQT